MHLPTTTSLLLCALLAGCATAGKDYAGPPATPRPAVFARAEAHAPAGEAPARWWSALHDPELDALETRALRANPNLDRARARLRQARASLLGERANALPKGSATALAAHVRLPKNNPLAGGGQGSGQSGQGGFSLPSSLSLYNIGFDASWEIDLFGGQRRATEAARAAYEASQASLADAQVSLAAEVAAAYVNLRSAQQRLALADAALARQQRAFDLSTRRVKGGTASELDLVRMQGQLEATRLDADPLRVQVDTYRDALATLAGVEPGALDAELGSAGAVPLPPAQVATGDPAAMLRRRPDLRAAERQLAARSAQVGAAQAARFPHLTLFGVIGIGGTHPSDLTHLDNFTSLAAPQLSWNVLDFGRARARVEGARGARDEAEAAYRTAVLSALRDAEDALARFRQGRITVATAARAKASAERASFLMAARQHAGTATLIDLLDTQRQQIAAEQNLAQAQAALTGAFIALQKALGLGWEDAGGPAGKSGIVAMHE